MSPVTYLGDAGPQSLSQIPTDVISTAVHTTPVSWALPLPCPTPPPEGNNPEWIFFFQFLKLAGLLTMQGFSLKWFCPCSSFDSILPLDPVNSFQSFGSLLSPRSYYIPSLLYTCLGVRHLFFFFGNIFHSCDTFVRLPTVCVSPRDCVSCVCRASGPAPSEPT